MRKALALLVTVCVGGLAVGCDPATPPKPAEVPKSDLGAPAGKPDGAKPGSPTTAPETTPPKTTK
jgi:hypothetical protein